MSTGAGFSGSWKEAVRRALGSLGYRIERIRPPRPPNPGHLWEDDPVFQRFLGEISDRTLVDVRRCHILFQLVRQVASVPGEMAEVGVYKGGTARLIARSRLNSKPLHLFDTFEGMPPTDTARDLHRQGDFADTSCEAVRAFVGDLPGIELHQGLFPETGQPLRDRRFSFVHVDADIFRSVLDCCEFFYPRLSPGGAMVFDDYGFVSCPGARDAVDQFLVTKPEEPIYLSTGQCLLLRLG